MAHKRLGNILSTLTTVILLAGVAALLTSCAAIDGKPRYQTKSTYIPPNTAAGKRCLNQCDATRLQCESRQDQKYQDCLSDVELRKKDCRRQASERRAYCLRNKAPSCDLQYSNTYNLCLGYNNSCSKSYSSCDRLQDRCFVNCGGKIEKNRVCVSNCDKVSQAPSAAYAICKAGTSVQIKSKWPDGTPLKNKFCGFATCAASGEVVRGPNSKGECLIQPELSPVADWVPYQLLTRSN